MVHIVYSTFQAMFVGVGTYIISFFFTSAIGYARVEAMIVSVGLALLFVISLFGFIILKKLDVILGVTASRDGLKQSEGANDKVQIEPASNS